MRIGRQDVPVTNPDKVFFPARGLTKLDLVSYYVAVAERFPHAAYLWGGRTSLGLDCSALVQLSLAAAGVAAPRDTDQQERALGAPLAGGIAAPLRRGDLVFWKGHVAILVDGETIIHANGHHLAVSVEPLRAAADRISRSGGAPTSIRRL